MTELATNNMAVAAVLYTNGKTPVVRVDPDTKMGEWVFPLEDGDDREFFEELISAVEKGEHQVEPLRFLRDVGQIRRMLYDALGISKSHSRRSG